LYFCIIFLHCFCIMTLPLFFSHRFTYYV
jgi:hypothetical protein